MLPRQGPVAGRGSYAPEASKPPVSLTRLIGRAGELAEVERLTDAHRLVTLTGAGGSGKTRLAAELAHRRIARGEQAIWVELTPCTDPALVAQQVAAALALRETSERNTIETLIEALCGRKILIALDNCEHVIDSAAALVGALLSQCPESSILATSREPLGVQGEQLFLVPPLAMATDAVELFVDRARASDPAFATTPDNMGSVEEICRRLDGIPLAIELAAARVRLLTPGELASRLEDRFAVLSGGARTSIARHRTLRATIDWSYALLNECEQALLERLSVFAGTFALEAAEAVCTDEHISRDEVLDLLGGLVDKSLVVASTRDSTARYSLLESIREYARERLSEEDEARLRRRHAESYLDLARSAVPELMGASVACLARLDADHDNVRAALAWSIEHEPDAIALPLAASFRWYWYYRISWAEGLRWLRRVLEASSPVVTHDRAATLTGAGALSGYLGDITVGRARLEEAASLWREVGDDRHLGYVLSALAHLLAISGELERAQLLATESIALVRNAGTPWDLGYCLTNAASFVAQMCGDLEAADRHLEEAHAIWAADHHPLGLPFVLNARALVALRRGDRTAAARFARTALTVTRESDELWFSSRSLRVIAHASLGNPLLAARLLAASDAILRSIAAGILPYEREMHRALMSSLRETLGDERLHAALDEGGRMSFHDACAAALGSGQDVADDSIAVPVNEPPRGLHVRDLGALQISLDGEALRMEARASGRARELLLFLLSNPGGCSKEEVGVAFWPDASTDAVKNSFHVTLHRLRKMLGQPGAVCVEGGRYRIGIPHSSDSVRFEKEIRVALRQSTSGAETLGPLEAALSLYGGDFLHGEDVGDWCLAIRSRLRQLYFRGLFAMGQGLEASGRYSEAADSYTRLLAREPLHEAACRQLMICHARMGARSQSMTIYRKLEQRLQEDLDTTPESETASLYRRLQQNEAI